MMMLSAALAFGAMVMAYAGGQKSAGVDTGWIQFPLILSAGLMTLSLVLAYKAGGV